MIISRTPMRVSFMGGGSDIPVYYREKGGAVVSAAIDRYIYFTVNKKFDDLIRVSYSQTELVESVDQVEHNIIREALKIVGVDKGIDVVYMGDVPLGGAGVGLGSSSSLAVGILNALYAYTGKHVAAERLAKEACEIEIDILGHPIGRQDQYAAAYGGLKYMRFNEDDSVFVDPIIISPETREALNNKLLLFYTGLTRFSSTILEEQGSNIDNNRGFLDEMVDMATTMHGELVKGNLMAVGELLDMGWGLKKKLAGSITNNQINLYYERAKNAGAIGGKILGAGGGGFLLLYCDEWKQDDVKKELSELKESPFLFDQQGSKIIYVSE